ncbi:YczE/YyaS/YitT family protein [Brevibacillus sp. NRS-1366]|uniref:YczE/YyaS/YitT family protein n=1 Tax=Brevibacillus sp. NRS-1366 TaxID=3233899 RepID=UPI003D20A988
MNTRSQKMGKRCNWLWWFRLGLFFAGLIMMSYGVALMIRANLGVSPWDVLYIGLTHSFGQTVGLWSQITGALLLLISSFLSKQLPTIGTLLNMLLVGWFIDWFLSTGDASMPTGIYQYVSLLAGIIAIGVGAGMYIASNLGAGPRDGIMLVLAEKSGWSIRKVKTVMEAVVLAAGWYLGGPVSIGTLVFAIMIGPVMQACIHFFRALLAWLNRERKYSKNVTG